MPTGGGGGSVRSAVVLGSVPTAGIGLGARSAVVLRYACMDLYVQRKLHMIKGCGLACRFACMGGKGVTVETAAAHRFARTGDARILARSAGAMLA